MIFLDAFAIIALVLADPGAREVRRLIKTGDCGVLSVNLAECADVLERVHKLEEAEIATALKSLLGSSVEFVELSPNLTIRAGHLRATHYHGKKKALSITDSILIAAAKPGDTIVTPDPPVVAVARQLGIEVISLPDSSGKSAPS